MPRLWRIRSDGKCSRFEGGGGYQCMRNAHELYMKWDFMRIFHKLWHIGTKYATHWYQFFTYCEEFVPILHSVKFTKCEICGSTRLQTPKFIRQTWHWCCAWQRAIPESETLCTITTYWAKSTYVRNLGNCGVEWGAPWGANCGNNHFLLLSCILENANQMY